MTNELNKITIDITWDCNLKCDNCSRRCDIAPTKDGMTVKQIKSFIDDTIKLSYPWKKIRLAGGEPTMHNDFFTIVGMFIDYKLLYNKNCKIEIASNCYGDLVKNKLSILPDFITIFKGPDINKRSKKFIAVNIAPIDIESDEKLKSMSFSDGCRSEKLCPLCLCKYGIYPSGNCASVDRILGANLGILELKDLNKESLKNMFQVLCRYCGCKYGKSEERLVLSETWKKLISKYKNSRPFMNIIYEDKNKI